MADRFLSALSLTRRAGALKTGYDAVCEAAQNGSAQLVLITADTSPKTRKRVVAQCLHGCKTLDIPYKQQDIAQIAGKAAGVLAVTNTDLAALCLNSMAPPAGAGAKEEPV